MTLTHEDFYIAYRDGDEKALEYVYTRYYEPLCNHGRKIIRDEFAVSCIVNEAFLKGWKFRQSMENMRHIYCFMRQDISWRCYAFLANPSNSFHRGLLNYDTSGNLDHSCDSETDKEGDKLVEKKLQAIEEALAYLPANRQTIIKLHYRYGYSYKRIARRFGTSGQSITHEVHQSLESLKKILHAQKRLDRKKPSVTSKRQLKTCCLDEITRRIFTLRYEERQSFAAIAQKLGLPQDHVQQQYVMAHNKLQENHAT